MKNQNGKAIVIVILLLAVIAAAIVLAYKVKFEFKKIQIDILSMLTKPVS